MEGRREELVMRKGPWMAEEDEILMDYVNKYGPRDWSSIRSKGLLPRTGKSCRLRWVNKLKPNLKTGCKFSAEEERIVIDLQARFGNKWARIATYLQGRTDNDVKNFWSTRQKRLARILQTPNNTKSQQRNNTAKAAAAHRQIPALEGAPKLDSITMEEGSSSSSKTHHPPPCQSSYIDDAEQVIKMVPLPDLVNLNLLNLEPNTLQIDMDKKPECFHQSQVQPHFSFPQLTHPTLEDLPLLPENQDLVTGLVGDTTTDLMDMFGEQVNVNGDEFSYLGLGENGRKGVGENENPATPDSFFDDFPTDMFDYYESLPSSSEW